MIITATAPIAGDPRTYWSCSSVTLHRVGMYRSMILAASGVLNDRPATTKHEVARNPAARGNALNYPRIDVRGVMLVDRGGKLVTGGRVSLCTDTTLHLLAGMLDQHLTDETGHIVEYQRAWRANRDEFAPVLSTFWGAVFKSLSLPGVLCPPILADWTALVQRARRRYRSPQPAILQPTIDRTGR